MLFDEQVLLNSLSTKDIIESLTIDDVVRFLESLGVEVDRFENHLICPTICHNPIEEAESRKLYWYQNYKVFHCYTECNESMSIFELYRRYMSLNEHEITLDDAELYVKQFLKNIKIKEIERKSPLTLDKSKYRITDNNEELIEYPISTISYFSTYYHPSWLKEGITKEVMDNFQIKFSLGQNKIIIPHLDFDGRLIGIRARALEQKDIELGKYMPITIGETIYAHRLQFNLYGLYQHKEAIQKYKRAVIFESEKSVLKDEVFYGKNSIAVACCGSSLSKYQVALLCKKLGVNEIVIAFDKEYTDLKDPKAKTYRNKLIEMCEKYKHLASFSYIYDEQNLLSLKDSPNDRGKEIYEKLYQNRSKIRW